MGQASLAKPRGHGLGRWGETSSFETRLNDVVWLLAGVRWGRVARSASGVKPPQGVTPPLMELGPHARASGTPPDPRPTQSVSTVKTLRMDLQRYASAAPLLKTPLSQRAADTTAAEAGVPLRTLCQVMLGLPPEVRADGPGQRSRPMGADTRMKAWGQKTAKLKEHAIQGKDTDEIRMPTLDDAGPVLKRGQGPWVF